MTSLITVAVRHVGKEVSIGDEALWIVGLPEDIDKALGPWGSEYELVADYVMKNADFVLPAGAFALHIFLCEALGVPAC